MVLPESPAVRKLSAETRACAAADARSEGIVLSAILAARQGPQQELAGFRFAPAAAAEIFGLYEMEVVRLLATHGWRAFEQPRSAALAHEVGHAMVAHHDGATVRKLVITRRDELPAAFEVWVGRCDIAGPRFEIGPDASPEFVLTQICKVAAGCISEKALDPSGVREASSLDEVTVSQLLANNLSLLREFRHRTPQEIWAVCWRRTAHVIKQNEDVARELIAKLSLTGSIRGTPLNKSLAKVRQVPGASVGDLERFLAGVA
jgi:hypothetical protein